MVFEIALRNCPESELSDDGGIATGLKDLRSLCSLCRSHWMIWMIWIYMDLSDLSDPLDLQVTKSGDRKHRKLKRFWHHSDAFRRIKARFTCLGVKSSNVTVAEMLISS